METTLRLPSDIKANMVNLTPKLLPHHGPAGQMAGTQCPSLGRSKQGLKEIIRWSKKWPIIERKNIPIFANLKFSLAL